MERGHHPHSHSIHMAGRKSREREREREWEREREKASDACGWNSLGQGREVLTFVNGMGAEFCA